MLTDKLITIRAKARIEFAFSHYYAAVQVTQKISLQYLFELMDVFTGENQLVDEEKKSETANFAARRNNISDKTHSNGNVWNYKEKDKTNKQLARDKHVKRCFVCNLENHFAVKFPQTQNKKHSKFEKIQRETRKEKLLPKRKKVIINERQKFKFLKHCWWSRLKKGD